MNRTNRFFSFATGCALAIAIAAPPLRGATPTVDQRAVKFGTTIPATCFAGDIFFKTDATAGSNLYACVALNTWVVQGGSTVINGGDVSGFTETRTSNTVMTTGLTASIVNVKFGTVVQSIASGGTVTLGTSSCAAGGLVWKSITPSGVLQIDANTNVNLVNVSVTGFVKGSNTVAGTPSGNFPMYRLSCGNSAADQWDTNMILDLRAFYTQKNVVGGTFVIPTEGGTGTTSLDIDPARIQGTDPNLMTAGLVTPGAGSPLCTSANGGATTAGCPASAPSISDTFANLGSHACSAANSGQLYFTNGAADLDGMVAVCDGISTWKWKYRGIDVTPPAISVFGNAFNAGNNSAFAAANPGVSFTGGNPGTGTNWAIRGQSTSFTKGQTVTLGLIPMILGGGAGNIPSACGLYFHDAGTRTFEIGYAVQGNSPPYLDVGFSDTNANDHFPSNNHVYMNGMSPFFIRVAGDPFTISFSWDKKTWVPFLATTWSTYVTTPTTVGIWCSDQINSQVGGIVSPNRIHVIDWSLQ
jgi:hypothetical protein